MAGENARLRCWTDKGYRSFKRTLTVARSKGDIQIVQNQVGFYINDGAIGDELAFIFGADLCIFPKVAGTAFTAGDDLFFDDVNLELTKNNAFRPVGTAERDAASGATEAWFNFHQEASGSY